MHLATNPTRVLGYLELPNATAKPPHSRINDLNALIQSVVFT